MLDPHDDTHVPSGSTDGAQMESTSSPVPREHPGRRLTPARLAAADEKLRVSRVALASLRPCGVGLALDRWSRPPLPACRFQRRCGVRPPAGGSPPPAWLPKRGYESRINHSFPAPVWRGHGDGPQVPPSQTSANKSAA